MKRMLRQSRVKQWHFHAASGLLYGVISGSLMFWPALQDHVSLWWFGGGAVALNVAGAALKFVGGGDGDEG